MWKLYSKFASLFVISCILSIFNVNAQAPLGFNYQGVALTNAGTPIASKVISLRIALIELQQLGTIRYQEIHNVNTDAYGQFSVVIGNGQAVTGKMTDVQWSLYPYYMKVELDLTGGTAFVFVGTSQLLSVPYALYANNAGAASVGVDSIKSILSTIKLTQKGDSIVLNNNRGSVYIPKIDSLTKIVAQIAGIKSGVIKYIRDSATKTPYGLAIGYDALKSMDTLVINPNNYAIGNGAGSSLLKNIDNSSNNDNILIGTASGATLGTTTSGGAMQNVIIGNNAGQNAKADATGNVLVGYEAGKNSVGSVGSKTVQFTQNVALGTSALQSAKNAGTNVSIGANNLKLANDVSRNVSIGANTALNYNGDDNVILGSEMLFDTSSNGSKNVIIGAAVATNLRGSGNVILGYKAASDSIFLNTNNKLIIANDKTKTPLIYGEFDNKKLTINGDLTVTGKLNGSNGSVSTIVQYGSNVGDSIYLNSDVDIYKTEDGRWNRNVYLPIPDTTNNLLSSRLKSTILISSGSSFSFNIKKENTNLNNDIVIKTNEFATFVFDGTKWLLTEGRNSLANNSTDTFRNTNIGSYTLVNNTTGKLNTAFGDSALFANTTGAQNVGIGYRSLTSNTSGYGNVAIGLASLFSNTSGWDNTAIGSGALLGNKSGNDNTANGGLALFNNTSGNFNTANGQAALFSNTIGNYNTASGMWSLNSNTTASNNTAIGSSSLKANTTGYSNVGLGIYSLFNNITGNNNVAIGDSSLYNSTTASGNTAVGSKALYSNTSGSSNTANGFNALYSNTTGSGNTANGKSALQNNTTGNYNTASGLGALTSNSTGEGNTANGVSALLSNTTGYSNTAIGSNALYSNISGSGNTANGPNALYSNTTGYSNTANGIHALFKNTIGSYNVASGNYSLAFNTTGSGNISSGVNTLYSNTTGSYNVASGNYSLVFNTTGSSNSALGTLSLISNTTGSNNTAIGDSSGFSNTTGSNNTALGHRADVASNNLTNATAIGNGAIVSASNTIQLGNTSITDVKTSGIISSTKGFLPPKFTAVQRDSITSPTTGLIVFCSNCGVKGQMQYFDGTDWVDMIGNTAISGLNIGSSLQGGKIAYILQSGDPGYDPNRLHGLIAATSDQSTSIQWYNGVNTSTGATVTAIGTGLSNTNAIIASQGPTSTDYAAGLARAYTGGGYTDWYLPSKDELNKLYLNSVEIGGFTVGSYWSSTENDSGNAWFQNFVYGLQYNNGKFYTFYIRAIRAF